MGFGAILVNIPLSSAITQIDPATGEILEVLNVFFDAGIATEIFPLLIFIAIGAMIDFSPLSVTHRCFCLEQQLNLEFS